MTIRRTRHSGIHTPSLILGGVLVAIGFATGRMDTATEAMSQAAFTEDISFLRSGGDMVVTASDDGLTLHVWSVGRGSQTIDPQRRPVYVGSIAGQ